MLSTLCHSRPVGIGIYEPDQVVTSVELLEQIDTSKFGVQPNWIDRVLGISERRFSDPGMRPSDLGLPAARQALEHAGISADQLGFILFVSIDRDYIEPATSHVIQHALGAVNATCLDLMNACHGFMNGIHFLDALIASGQLTYGLIVSGEQPSRVSQIALEKLKRHSTREKFNQYVGGLSVGDSGAAMVIGPKTEDDLGFQAMRLYTKGAFTELCAYGEANDPTYERGGMDMRSVVTNFMQMHAEIYDESLAYFGWTPEDIDHFVGHQVGKKAFKMHAEYSGVPVSKMPDTVSKYGNLTSATIPFNLGKMMERNELKPGDKIFISVTGSGLTISQTALVWG